MIILSSRTLPGSGWTSPSNDAVWCSPFFWTIRWWWSCKCDKTTRRLGPHFVCFSSLSWWWWCGGRFSFIDSGRCRWISLFYLVDIMDTFNPPEASAFFVFIILVIINIHLSIRPPCALPIVERSSLKLLSRYYLEISILKLTDYSAIASRDGFGLVRWKPENLKGLSLLGRGL